MTPAAAAPAPSGVITITTDFGHQGPFVGVIKGCILTRFPEARLVDLTHEIVVHWPAEAGFWLARAFGYFPAGTVHVAVVDPGVGTSRHIISPIDHHLDPRKVSEKWNRPIVRALNATAALNSANTERRVDKYEYVNPKIVTRAAEAI